MKSTAQCNAAASKANKMLGLLCNTFCHRGAELWSKLYSVYVRPLLEFGIQAWNPYLSQDINILEKIQRRATRIPHATKGMTYVERLLNFDLTTLSARRLRGDLIEKFKLENGFETVEWHTPQVVLPPRAGRRTRLVREVVRACKQRHNFFNNRIVNAWNALPDSIISAKSVNAFKSRYDRYVSTATSRHLLLTWFVRTSHCSTTTTTTIKPCL